MARVRWSELAWRRCMQASWAREGVKGQGCAGKKQACEHCPRGERGRPARLAMLAVRGTYACGTDADAADA